MEIEARTLRNVRVIARLDIKQGRLIKGVQMEVGVRLAIQPSTPKILQFDGG